MIIGADYHAGECCAESSKWYHAKNAFLVFGDQFISHFMRNCDKWLEKDEYHGCNLHLLYEIMIRIKSERCRLQLIQIIHGRDNQCCPFSNTLDGRWTIFNKKLPHPVFLCKLFRWSDVHTMSELEQVHYCRFDYKRHADVICINPFHYVRDLTKKRIPVTMKPMNYYQTNIEIPVDLSNITNIWITIYHYMKKKLNKWVFEGRENPVYINASSGGNPEFYSLFCEEFIAENPKIMNKLLNVGRGITIVNAENGVFVVSSLSYPIYFRSCFMNMIHGFNLDTIIQVNGGETAMIFNFRQFVSFVNKIADYSSLDKIQSYYDHGKITMSFFNTWGVHGEYEDITDHDFYVEIILHHVYIILNNVARFIPKEFGTDVLD